MSSVVTPIQMAIFEFCLSVISCVAFVAFGQWSYEASCASLIGIGFGLAALYPAGILIARQRAPLSSSAISRFIAFGLVGTMVLPSAVGAFTAGRPALLSCAELGFVLMQASCFAAVAWLPQYDSACSSSSSNSSSTSTINCSCSRQPAAALH